MSARKPPLHKRFPGRMVARLKVRTAAGTEIEPDGPRCTAGDAVKKPAGE